MKTIFENPEKGIEYGTDTAYHLIEFRYNGYEKEGGT
jgi:hypothetical protein